jgi:chloride channel 3/4/5
VRGSFIQTWRAATQVNEDCSDWRTWGEVWSGSNKGGEGGSGDLWAVDYIAFVVIALLFAVTSSLMTLYLSSSTSVFSSKDSPSVPHPGFSPDFSHPGPVASGTDYGTTAEEKPLPVRPRKTMYFAAGSGIPEIKTILSGSSVLNL